MEILEKLYNAAALHLDADQKNWEGFAQEFKAIFRSNVFLYRLRYKADNVVDFFDVISTSDTAITEAYVENKMYLNSHVQESDLPPLEPARRTDDMSDEDFKKLGPFADFMIGIGAFYIMAVPAILPDGTIISLAVFRTEELGDFYDLDKQRLALFMRHLMVFIDEQEFVLEEPESDIVKFGNNYSLTDTEVQILSALLNGNSLKLIAQETERAYGTVRWHVQNILEKCQVGNQKDLLREFYKLIKH